MGRCRAAPEARSAPRPRGVPADVPYPGCRRAPRVRDRAIAPPYRADALDLADVEQLLGSWERSDDLVADLDRVGMLGGEPVLDDLRLAHRDPLADDERGGCLVRGVEADRAEPVVALLERAEHRVALADGLPA